MICNKSNFTFAF